MAIAVSTNHFYCLQAVVKPVALRAALLVIGRRRGSRTRSTEGAAVQHGQRPNRWVPAVQILYMPAVQMGTWVYFVCTWAPGV